MDDPPAAGALYIAGPDGSDNTMIGRRWEYTVPFGWSPDGSRIAYVTGTDSPDSRAVVPQNVVRREMLARDGCESGHAARCRPLARAPTARRTRVERGIRLRPCGARGSYSTPCESQALA